MEPLEGEIGATSAIESDSIWCKSDRSRNVSRPATGARDAWSTR
jgi:hypothetical protein